MLGDFLEFSVASRDVLTSVRFYERLGFTQIRGNDTWSHAYGVVTDGRCTIGIHDFEFPAPALTFVAPELRTRVASLEAAGARFEFLKLGDDQFHELGFYLPDDQMITLLEARTFSPPDPSDIRPTPLEFFAEYRIPVDDADAAAEQWRRFGLLESEPPDEVHGGRTLCMTGLNVGVTEARRLRRPALVFHVSSLDLVLATLAERDIEPAELFVQSPRQVPRAAMLRAPEGTSLLLVQTAE